MIKLIGAIIEIIGKVFGLLKPKPPEVKVREEDDKKIAAIVNRDVAHPDEPKPVPFVHDDADWSGK